MLIVNDRVVVGTPCLDMWDNLQKSHTQTLSLSLSAFPISSSKRNPQERYPLLIFHFRLDPSYEQRIVSHFLSFNTFPFLFCFCLHNLFFFCSDYLFKLLLIGDSSVGKSCLLLRFAVSWELSIIAIHYVNFFLWMWLRGRKVDALVKRA
jgi:hypothetical protein